MKPDGRRVCAGRTIGGRRAELRQRGPMIAPASDLGSETLDRDASIPLYLQLAGLLRNRIERGEWRAGQKIPSENELNRLYGVSRMTAPEVFRQAGQAKTLFLGLGRMTARQVPAQLVNENLLFRVQGKGTFVAHPKISTRSPAYKGIREQLEGMGYAVATKVLANDIVPADDPAARALRIPIGEPVHEIRRVRLITDGEPISLHTSYVPQRLAPVFDIDDLVHRQLCAVLEEDHGLRMSRVS